MAPERSGGALKVFTLDTMLKAAKEGSEAEL